MSDSGRFTSISSAFRAEPKAATSSRNTPTTTIRGEPGDGAGGLGGGLELAAVDHEHVVGEVDLGVDARPQLVDDRGQIAPGDVRLHDHLAAAALAHDGVGARPPHNLTPPRPAGPGRRSGCRWAPIPRPRDRPRCRPRGAPRCPRGAGPRGARPRSDPPRRARPPRPARRRRGRTARGRSPIGPHLELRDVDLLLDRHVDRAGHGLRDGLDLRPPPRAASRGRRRTASRRWPSGCLRAGGRCGERAAGPR
jgi:hypothetical protein